MRVTRKLFKRPKVESKLKTGPSTSGKRVSSKIALVAPDFDKAIGIRQTAVSYANKKRASFPGLAEDFGSYCVIRYLENRLTKMGFMWIDYLRVQYGNPNNSIGYLKAGAHLRTIQPDDIETLERAYAVAPTQHSLDHEQYLVDLIHSSKRLTIPQRMSLILRVVFGFSVLEISQVLNISKGRVSQMLNPALDYMREKDFEAFENY